MSNYKCLAVKMKNELSVPIFQLIREMGSLAQQMGQRVYLVGGFVRDLLLGEANFDLDVVVEGDGTVFAAQLADRLLVKTSVNTQFGTASLRLPDGWRIDVATARTETYPFPGALPQVQPASLTEDLRRRDFSINAMAIALHANHFGQLNDPCQGQDDFGQLNDPCQGQDDFGQLNDPCQDQDDFGQLNDPCQGQDDFGQLNDPCQGQDDFGQLIDPCQGQDDLVRRQIRVLHSRSFYDDPTRLIRATRFAARFGFSLEAETQALVEQAAAEHLLRLVSPPRIREELMAVFLEEDPYACLELLDQFGIWPDIDPQMPPWSSVCGWVREIPPAIRIGEEYFPQIDKSMVYLTAICAGMGSDVESAAELLQRLQVARRYPKNILRSLEQLQRFRQENPGPDPGPACWHKLLGSLSGEGIIIFLAAGGGAVPAIRRYLEQRRQTQLSLNGEDLQLLELPPGPERKNIMDQVYLARLEGAPGGRKSEMDIARKIIAAKRGGKQ